MADFYQTGIIITLHKLGRPSLEKIESEMVEFSKQRPIALVLPALYTEFQSPALHAIINQFKKIVFLPWGFLPFTQNFRPLPYRES